MNVVVIGQIARDLVLLVDGLPDEGATTLVRQRREMLGGKGANQAVGLANRGCAVQLIGVVGDDPVGAQLLAQATRDGVGTAGVVTRRDTRTALHVDVTDGAGARWLFDDVPDVTRVRVADVDAAAPLLRDATAVVVQLQQPYDTALHAARAVGGQARVYLDGAPDGDVATLLAHAHVVRADAAEAQRLAGRALPGVEDVVRAARELLACGPSVVALAAPGADVVAWRGGDVVIPHDDLVADPTGGGDAFMAAFVHALEAGHEPDEAGRRASAAAGAVVARIGGRPPEPG